MRVVIAGGHGQIALKLERMLSREGDQAVGLVRNPDHVADLEAVGAEAVVLDLEKATVDELAQVVQGADAVVFAAGGGPNSGPERKDTVDRGAAVLLADAAEQAGVRRYVLVSSMGTENVDPDSDDVMAIYLRAKAAADEDVRNRDLDATIVKPGRLTDDEGSEQIAAGPGVEYGEIPRADVAATLLAVLRTSETVGKQFNLVSGGQQIKDALATL
ncbi:MAG TPA: SDR family oxidoreductase [Nocardioidaceae bacterium]|nr:SDR family oxidoreductase [Nocardioidaceae bacterium]